MIINAKKWLKGDNFLKILNITEPEAFFKVLDKCEGEVFLVTSEGDNINLKSKLCQYIALSKLFSESKIDEIEIKVTKAEDMNLLINYLIRA